MVFLPHLVQAQISITRGVNNDLAPVRPDTIVQVAADSQGLQLVLPEQVPACGTFWWVVPGGAALPTPCPPPDLSGAIYQIADGQFLVDETGGQVVVNPRRLGLQAQAQVTSRLVASAAVSQADSLVNLITQVQIATASPEIQTLSLAKGLGVPIPGGGSDDGNGTNSSDATGYTVPDYGTNLWIAQVAVASGNLTGIGTNTLADIQYDILSRTNLVQTDWQTENSIFGSETTNWTPFSVAQNNRTNLFILLRSDASTDGSGLPDWWELEYFGTTGVNPYGNPAGDGWNNLQKFQNGMNPNDFYTPAAPQSLTVSYNADNNTATLNWLPVAGDVTGYTVKKNDYMGNTVTYPLSANTTGMSDNNSRSDSFYTRDYSVQANYIKGNSVWNTVSMQNVAYSSVSEINGAQGYINFVLYDQPADLSVVRIFRSSQQDGSYIDGILFQVWPGVGAGPDYPVDLPDGYFDIPVANFTNGIAAIPANQAFAFGEYLFSAQFICSNGVSSTVASYNFANNDVFLDGRAQLKDNLRFRIRAATDNGPFEICGTREPMNYVYSGLYNGGIWPLNPFSENNIFRNFVLDANNLLTSNVVYNQYGYGASIGMPNTGVFYNYPFDEIYITNGEWYVIHTSIALSSTPVWQADFASFITINGLPSAPASVLTASLSQWILPAYGWVAVGGMSNEKDMYPDNKNYYGLTCQRQMSVIYTNNQFYYISQNLGDPLAASTGIIYLNSEQPIFQSIGYYFARPYTDPLPEQNASDYQRESIFSTTNTTPLIITSIGNSIQIAGYAKLAIQNGYSGIYAYLGQYFDHAYKVDVNGNVTTTNTGVLSPYGNFFATEPGPVALVTMPDIDTGERGTCMVYSIGMVIDRTQRTNMDARFNGPNATSSANPAVIWANNNYDRGHTVDGSDFEQDDLGPIDVAKLPSNQQMSDAFYAIDGQPAIPCTRDLEDYFRLWTPGVAALMNVLPTNYTVQLKLSGDGQIRIYQAIEPDGGTNYLFDEATASNQVINSASLHVGLLSSTMPIVLHCSSNFNEHFIFCGAHTGSAKVDLQVLDGNQNVVADTVAYLQINNIKNMYERWTVGDNPKVAPITVPVLAANDLSDPTQPLFKYSAPIDTTTPYILFVHGWNLEAWEKDRYAETAYKRLYWQGYKGRFGIFQWPTDNGITGATSAIIHHKNYDNSESNAWASATGLMNLLTQLNTEYPGNVYLMAHSMGNVVAGEALRLAGTNQLVNTYAAMQAAIPAHCYDPTTPVRSSYEAPDRYANYWTGNSPCYFNGTAGAGTCVNFYNTNDYALGKWTLDQDWKPDTGYQYARLSDLFIRGTFTETLLYFPNDTYEIFAYADPAWSYALGAQADVGGAFKLGQTYQQIELDIAPYNFDRTHKYHSGQFRSDNQSRAIFWNTLLKQIKLFP